MQSDNEHGTESGNETGSNAATPASLDFSGMGEELPEQLNGSNTGDITRVEDDDNNDDENASSDNEDGDESDSDEEEDAAAAAGLSASEREILTLLAVDKKLASVLELAADALSALKIPEDASASLSLDERAAAFETSAGEYYTALDDIQLTLRNSIQVIRKARISPRILLDNPNAASSRSGPIGLGSIPKTSTEEGEDGLSRGARRMETKAWGDALAALKKLLPAESVEPKQEDRSEADGSSPNEMG